MVTNVTALPPVLTQTPVSRAPGATESERPAAQSAAAVDIDPANIEYRDDVLAAREDVADARDGVDFAIAAARQARSVLADARDLAARAADPAVPDAARAAHEISFRASVQQLGQIVDTAIGQGAPLIAGDTLSVRADPDSDAAIDVAGFDLRLKSAVTGEEALLLTRGASIADVTSAGESARAADQSLSRIDAGLKRLDAEATRLSQHDSLLGALDAALATNVAPDLGADAARLLALQVRQELSQSSAPIANVKPNAVLSLFRD